MRRMALRTMVPLVAIGWAIACAAPRDGATGDSAKEADALPSGHPPLPPTMKGTALTPAAQALLDSGNAEFRAGRHREALTLYQRVATSVPLHPAPWFGTFMAARALGDSALADSAQRMIRERAPGVDGHPGGAKGASPASPHAVPSPPA